MPTKKKTPGSGARARITKLNDEKALIGTQLKRAGTHKWVRYTGGPLRPGDQTFDPKTNTTREQRAPARSKKK